MAVLVLVLTAVASSLGGVVFGYELGVISGALPALRTLFRLDCVGQEAVVSALLAGSLTASLTGGWMIDRHSRRMVILLSSLLVLGGCAMLSVTGSLWGLLVGRGIVGFAMSISSTSCCIFVSETAAPERRGSMVTLHELGITCGFLLAYVVNFVFQTFPDGWRYMFGFAALPCFLQLVSVALLPKQPNSTSESPHTEQQSFFYLFQSKDNMCRRTVLGLSLVLGQQFSGQPNVLLYASTVLHSLGFRSEVSAVQGSVGLGVVKVLATLLAAGCADRVGRRALLMAGCSVMAVALMLMGLLMAPSVMETSALRCSSQTLNASHAYETPPGGETEKWLVFLCLMIVVSAFSISFGPMTWLVLSEIFPAEVRGRAFSFINFFNVTANLIVTSTFLNIAERIGLTGIFLMQGAAGVASLFFIFFTLPETKGKSLQEIDQELSNSRFVQAMGICSTFRKSHPSPRYHRLRLESLVE